MALNNGPNFNLVTKEQLNGLLQEVVSLNIQLQRILRVYKFKSYLSLKNIQPTVWHVMVNWLYLNLG